MNTNAAITHTATPPPSSVAHGMSLRLKINLIFSGLTVLIFVVLLALEIAGVRASVREEMEASSRIASQLLGRVTQFYARDMMPELVAFLRDTGRVRANDIRLYDSSGALLYESPPSLYKAGRDAPVWYAELVRPPVTERVIELDRARLVLTANPTRAILDGWDNLAQIFFSQILLLLLADVMLFWLVGRWLAPLERIERGLREIEQGDHHVRLPPLQGKEAGEMGRAFNRMAQAVEDNIQVRQASAEAQARLGAQREFTMLLHARIEEERAAIARELHDELGQSLTAIRSIAKSMMQHPDVAGGPMERHAQMLFDTAGMTSDAMRRLIPRLRPIQLEGMGLIDAVRDLLTETQQNHPQVRFELSVAHDGLPPMDDQLELSAYRIVQEAITNIVRHADASRAMVVIGVEQQTLKITIADNGKGADSLQRDGHYGVRGMQERAAAFGGEIAFGRGAEGGLAVRVALPITVSREGHDEKNN